MPIYTFKCPGCGFIVERLVSSYLSKCEFYCECGAKLDKIPSLTAKRRDMTVAESHRK